MTTLNFTLTVEGLESNTFVVREFKGQESISQLEYDQGKLCNGYNFDVQLASRRARVSAEDVVDKSVELNIYRNQERVQTISGIVRSFSKGDTGHHHTFYALTLVPALERLALRHNSRIFQVKTVPEIISILLKEMDIEDYAFSLQREYAQREFCVQYRETDLDFLHRLAAEEGLTYSFSFEKGTHTLIFSDASANRASLPSPIPYNSLSGGHANRCYISAFNVVTTTQPNQAALKDYSFKQPAYDFQQDALGTDLDYQRQDYQHFDAPGRFKSDQTGNSINQVRLEYLRRDSHVATGNSDVPYLQAGIKFCLDEHLDKELNREWLIVSVEHQGTQPQALEEEAGSGATTYSNKFKVIPSQYNWQPEPSLKPLVDGPMIALVVGPEGEEIYCDEFGRVKIQFPWDRYSQGDEHSSCWVRVSQGWTGSKYGIMAIPRIGHEVIVEFLNGDPDQPIITCRAYHATNTPPYSLPEHKTKTVIRSETHQGEGYNELSFEDQSQNEQIFIHAQKDWDSEINNDHTEHVKRDQHVVIENDEFERVQNNTNQTVEGESRSQVTQDKTLIVEGSLHVKTGSVWVNDSGSEIHVKAGNKIVIEAGSEITLKAAGSFLKVDPAGVHLVGAGVNLNSGGSAGSGSGYSGQVAELPNILSNEIAVEKLKKNSVTASQQNANSNVITEFSAPDEVVYESQSSSPNNSAPTAAPSSSTSKSSGEEESQTDDDKALRLKSPLLKQSLTLDKLANRESHAYKSGSSGEEVEYIQQALIKLGFDLGNAGADGDFGPTTKRQVELFQKEYKATNKTHLAYEVGSVDGIVGQGTLLGLDEALVEGWVYDNDEMDPKWLIVPKGQLTFDAEGNDVESSIYFSRTIHWPGGNSGITIGRGYDLGQQTSASSDLKAAGVSKELSEWLVNAQGKRGIQAKQHYDSAPASIKSATITRKQQYLLFNNVYDLLEKDVSRISKKEITLRAYHPNKKINPDDAWDAIPQKIRDLLVDLRFRGDYTPTSRKLVQTDAYNGDTTSFSDKLADKKNWTNVPLERVKVRANYAKN